MDIDYNVSRNILEEGLRVKFSIITIKWKNTKRCITNMVFIKRETKYCEHSKRMHSKFIFYAFLFALKKEKLKNICYNKSIKRVNMIKKVEIYITNQLNFKMEAII